jgi:HPt (histidine-containing phosphotransfer) domain-containing protein
MFLDESEKRIAAISSAKSSGDMKALKAEAHALKGTGGNIGAPGVHRIASDLQEAAEQGLPALLDDLVAKLKTELFAVEEALKRRLKSLDEEGSAGGASA